MRTTAGSRPSRRGRRRAASLVGFVALRGVLMLSIGAVPVAGLEPAGPPAAGAVLVSDTGFTQPFAGPAPYQDLAATEMSASSQLNQPLGLKAADALAARLGLSPADAFTPRQYVEFITGGGIGGNKEDAKLVDESVRIFTNTVGRPLYSSLDGRVTATTLASYGLFVTSTGTLESLANTDAPTRQVNTVIAPSGYLGQWCRANGATALLRALYRSPYTVEATYGYASQLVAANAELVDNHRGGVRTTVGMSMVPSIWLVNFILLYLLKPSVAALMPAYWAPIPAAVADAIEADPSGRVPFSQYASSFPSSVTG